MWWHLVVVVADVIVDVVIDLFIDEGRHPLHWKWRIPHIASYTQRQMAVDSSTLNMSETSWLQM